jgi:hypothetical protein
MRILANLGTDIKTYVNAYHTSEGGNLGYLSGDQVYLCLHATVQCIGIARRGFPPEDIVTHSIHSGTVLAFTILC